MCQPKEKGGLDVGDIRVVNVSLLAKWRWRLLNEDHALWKEVLVEKYGNHIGNVVEGGVRFGCRIPQSGGGTLLILKVVVVLVGLTRRWLEEL